MHTFYFEKLEVWQNARELAKKIYIVTAEFPVSETYGTVSQLRRAAMSIAANIAEGMSRAGNRDKLKFLNQAYSSAIEVLNFLILCHDLEFLKQEDYEHLRRQVEQITNQVRALSAKIAANQL